MITLVVSVAYAGGGSMDGLPPRDAVDLPSAHGQTVFYADTHENQAPRVFLDGEQLEVASFGEHTLPGDADRHPVWRFTTAKTGIKEMRVDVRASDGTWTKGPLFLVGLRQADDVVVMHNGGDIVFTWPEGTVQTKVRASPGYAFEMGEVYGPTPLPGKFHCNTDHWALPQSAMCPVAAYHPTGNPDPGEPYALEEGRIVRQVLPVSPGSYTFWVGKDQQIWGSLEPAP
jgi:hypothetical protein